MNRFILSLLIFLWSTSAIAQFTVEEIKEETDIGTYTFPVVKSQQQPEVAKKINKSLQMSELGLVITSSTKKPLTSLTNEDVYEYTVICNNERVFSLEISTGHNGAGSHFQFRNYSFDARTGNVINQNLLFSPSRLGAVKQALCTAWKESIKASLNDRFAEDYKQCLTDAKTTTQLEISRMAVNATTVDLWGGSFLDGTVWFNDLTRGPHRIPYEQLLSMLTPYGLSLFAGSSSSPGSLQQVLIKGKIDSKYNVTLFFTKADDSEPIKGILVYDKFNTPIELSGSFTDNKVLFHEMDATHAPVSDIECNWDGKNLNGTFKNPKTGKVMTFAAAAQ